MKDGILFGFTVAATRQVQSALASLTPPTFPLPQKENQEMAHAVVIEYRECDAPQSKMKVNVYGVAKNLQKAPAACVGVLDARLRNVFLFVAAWAFSVKPSSWLLCRLKGNPKTTY